MKAMLSQPINSLRACRRQLLGVVIAASLVSIVALGCPAPGAGTTTGQSREAEATATTEPNYQAVDTTTTTGSIVAKAPVPTATATATPVPIKPTAPAATPTPAIPTADQLLAATIRATSAARTLKFDSQLVMNMNVSGQKPMTVSMAGGGSGAANLANREMQMNMNIDMDIPEQGKQKMTMEMYIVGGYAYIKMAIPGAGDQWVKMKLTDQMWQEQLEIDQQLEMLRTASQLRIVGSEDVGGVPAYVVEIVPDAQAMVGLLGQAQVPGMEDVDISKLGAVADMFKNITFRYWISKDKNLLVRVDIRMGGELPPSATVANPANFELSLKGNYSWDQPVSITLPQEAQGAREVPNH